eukprot:scaffold2668_cov319-Prasinococcus_capsulatus_cf.AAC.8
MNGRGLVPHAHPISVVAEAEEVLQLEGVQYCRPHAPFQHPSPLALLQQHTLHVGNSARELAGVCSVKLLLVAYDVVHSLRQFVRDLLFF